MRYLLLIYNNPTAPVSDADRGALMRGHADLYRQLAGAGTLISSAALAAPAAATTVRVEAHHTVSVTDGPFVEAKEHLAGYYLVECDTLEQAVEIAHRVPCGAAGAVEIRPVDEATTRAVRDEPPAAA